MEDKWIKMTKQEALVPEWAQKEEDAKLSAKQRKRLPRKAFAGKKRSYPIHDLPHGRAALRLLHHASPSQQKTIRAKVYKKYPQLKKNKGRGRGRRK